MDKTKYRTAAYLRLSKGDGDAGSESNSISNQRLIIDRFLHTISSAPMITGQARKDAAAESPKRYWTMQLRNAGSISGAA